MNLSPQVFADAVKTAVKNGASVPTEAGESLEAKLARLQPLFDRAAQDERMFALGLCSTDGRLIQTTRDGRVRLHDPETGSSDVIAQIPVYAHSEDGLYGPEVDNNFNTNKWVYLYFGPADAGRPCAPMSACNRTARASLAANRPTGARFVKPSSAVSFCGKTPCHQFATGFPPGRSSSPQDVR